MKDAFIYNENQHSVSNYYWPVYWSLYQIIINTILYNTPFLKQSRRERKKFQMTAVEVIKVVEVVKGFSVLKVPISITLITINYY